MARSAFPGFPEEALTFFRGLERNNRREWFQPRKPIFDEQVKGPMLELVAALNAEMQRFAPMHVTEPESAIYRIYRDTRFSKDKKPYKTHIAAYFPRQRHGSPHRLGLLCRRLAQGSGRGWGLYMPTPEILRAVRNRIAERHAEFRKHRSIESVA